MNVPMANILVVDDNAAVARMMARLLQSRGYGASVASNGPDALTAIREQRPDLVVLDMMMPDMDGLEVMRRIREESTDAATPVPAVIVFSAVDNPKLVEQAMAAGARDYWVKASFKFEEMPQRLAPHLPGEQGAKSE